MEDNKLVPNSTQIPNVIIDLILPRIPEGEIKCLVYICRRTYGFHKELDRISLSQFVEGIKSRDGEILDYGAGVCRSVAVESLRNLVGSGIVETIKTAAGSYFKININLFLNKDLRTVSDEVVGKVNQFRKQTRSGRESKPKVVGFPNLQKKGNKGKQSNRVSLLVNYFFELKGWADKDKNFYIKNQIVYARFTGPAKKLLTLCDEDIDRAKERLKKLSEWAISCGLEWGIDTVLKKWYELDTLKAKEKKQYYRGDLIVESRGKKWVVQNGEFLEFDEGNVDPKEIQYK